LERIRGDQLCSELGGAVMRRIKRQWDALGEENR